MRLLCEKPITDLLLNRSTILPYRHIEEQAPRQEPAGQTTRATGQAQEVSIIYPKGPIGGLPDEHASRRERFAELDDLQPGWQVELRSRGAGGAVDAAFYSPTGDLFMQLALMQAVALATESVDLQ